MLHFIGYLFGFCCVFWYFFAICYTEQLLFILIIIGLFFEGNFISSVKYDVG